MKNEILLNSNDVHHVFRALTLAWDPNYSDQPTVLLYPLMIV